MKEKAKNDSHKKPKTHKSVMAADDVKKMMKKYADKKKIGVLSSFFKTGKGQYGEGDIFIGITVPHIRAVAKAKVGLEFPEISKLLKDPIHEYRLCALIILTYKIDALYNTDFKNALKRKDEDFLTEIEMKHKQIVDFYLTHLIYVNNWDLVDQSASRILGSYLFRYKREEAGVFLKYFTKSKNIWVRRVAMIATMYGIVKLEALDEAFEIAQILLYDSHDLIQKAVGWMLREAGKRNEKRLKKFLEIHAANMPRTTLRYAIERLDQKDKVRFMKMA